jgi:zinc protease
MVIAVVGAVDSKRVVDEVHKAFGTWSNRTQETVPDLDEPRALRTSKRRHHTIAGKSQTDIIVGTNGPRRRDPGYHAAALGNSVLGQFGMMGRIGRAVREQSGLAYYAYSQLDSGVGPGTWTVSAGVNPSNVERAVDLIVTELRRFVERGISPKELQDNKAHFIGRLPLSLESNAGVANALLNIERHELGLDYYQKYASHIQSVSREAVVETARRFIDPDRLVIASAGP